MKHLKRIVYPMLAAILLFTTACNNGKKDDEKNTDNLAGRYVETDITPPVEGQFVSFLAADGTIVCFEQGLATRYESSNGGETWNEMPGPGRGNDRFENVRSGALLPDGSLLVFIQGEGMAIVSADGNCEHCPVAEIDKAIANGDNIMISSLLSLGNDRFLLEYNTGGMMMQIPDSSSNGTDNGGGGPSSGSGPVSVNGAGTDDDSGPAFFSVVDVDDDSDTEFFTNRDVDDDSDTEFFTNRDIDDDSGPVLNSGSDTQNHVPNTVGSGPVQQGSGYQGQSSSSGNRTSGMSLSSRKTSLYELSTGRLIADLPSENMASAAAYNDSLYLMDMQGSVRE
ncbi:MAG: hypothetical protein LBH28_06865, partial [Oscillospiraceae bacterium]|nr:hypothetical protein [Oscillospiraceae bacterium]